MVADKDSALPTYSKRELLNLPTLQLGKLRPQKEGSLKRLLQARVMQHEPNKFSPDALLQKSFMSVWSETSKDTRIFPTEKCIPVSSLNLLWETGLLTAQM